jgi:hypothetical protein
MKKGRFIGILSVVMLCLFTLLSGISHSGVRDGHHNLAADMANPDPPMFTFQTRQVCVFCHTPHQANSQVREFTGIVAGASSYYNTSGGGAGNPILLWNQALSNVDEASGSYSVYASSTIDADLDEVRVYSLMCLSCHDGVGAMNVMTNPPNPLGDPLESFDSNGYPIPDGDDQIGDVPMAPGAGGPNIGERDPASDSKVVELSNDHPISFDYDTAQSLDSGLVAIATVKGNGLRFFQNPSGEAAVSMECSSCHDPHNQGDDSDPSSNYPFLMISNQGSALCTTCHLK